LMEELFGCPIAVGTVDASMLLAGLQAGRGLLAGST
jgi:hypothetical protein